MSRKMSNHGYRRRRGPFPGVEIDDVDPDAGKKKKKKKETPALAASGKITRVYDYPD